MGMLDSMCKLYNQFCNIRVTNLERTSPKSMGLRRKPGLRDLKHFCAICGRSRSSRFQQDHPIAPGETPISGICSRPRCAAIATGTGPSTPIVVEVHHHVHTHYPDQRVAAGSFTRSFGRSFGDAVELPVNKADSKDEGVYDRPSVNQRRSTHKITFVEQPPPVINWSAKPTLI